jgi:hypothetical protein
MSLPSNESTCHIAPSLLLFFSNSQEANSHFFFSESWDYEICNRPRLHSLWLDSRGDYSPKAPVAPSLRSLVPSGFLISCELVKVYHHYPRSMDPFYVVHHSPFQRDFPARALPLVLKHGWYSFRPEGPIEPHFFALVPSLRIWPVCCNKFSSGHWPAPRVGGHNCGCRIDSPINLARDWSWVVPCRGMPQTAGRRAVGVFFRTLGRCSRVPGAGVWCSSCSISDIPKPFILAETPI